MKNLIILLLIPFIMIGCATNTKFGTTNVPPLKFEATPTYNVDDEINSIEKPKQIEPIFVKIDESKNTFQIVTDPELANYILLPPSEYAKVGALVKLAGTYKKVIYDQESLINAQIEVTNAYKELASVEREKVISYRNMWIDSETKYIQERKDHRIDNVINRTMWFVTAAGTIAAFVFAF